MSNPSALAQLVFEFLENADHDDVRAFALALRIAQGDTDACPQGAAIKVAYLNEVVADLALGGVLAADREADDARARRDRAPRASVNDHRPDGDDERDEAREDVKSALVLKRILLTNAARAAKASRDILDQVPN